MAGKLRAMKLYRRVLGIRGLFGAASGLLGKEPVLLQMNKQGIKSPVYLRVPSSDVRVFSQIFFKDEYKFEVNREPELIIDAGANIGLASVYLANQFPNARILAIEPEKRNFEILVKNVAAYPNIEPLLGALWSEKTEVEVVDPGLGNWAFKIEAPVEHGTSSESPRQKVQGMTIDMILEKYGAREISILKLDIEGAECEVFRKSASWIDKISSLIVELHDHAKPGCNRSFYTATRGFDIEWSQGEFVYLARIGGCLKNNQNGRSFTFSDWR
jgi:FkbM family methyltransferase